MNRRSIDSAARAAYEEAYLESRCAEWDDLSEAQKVRWYRIAREAIEAWLLAER